MWPQPPPYPWPNVAGALPAGMVAAPTMSPQQQYWQFIATGNPYGMPGYGNVYMSHATQAGGGDDALAEQAASWAHMHLQMEQHQQEQLRQHAAAMLAMQAAMPPPLPPPPPVLNDSEHATASFLPEKHDEESFTPPPVALLASLTEKEAEINQSDVPADNTVTDILPDESLMPASALLASASAAAEQQQQTPVYTSVILQAAAATAAASMQLAQPNPLQRGISRIVPPWLREGIEKRQKEKQKEREKMRELMTNAALAKPAAGAAAVSETLTENNNNFATTEKTDDAELEGGDHARISASSKNEATASLAVGSGSSSSSTDAAGGNERKKLRVSRFSDAFNKSFSTASSFLNRIVEKEEEANAAELDSPSATPVRKFTGGWKAVGDGVDDEKLEQQNMQLPVVNENTRQQISPTPPNSRPVDDKRYQPQSLAANARRPSIEKSNERDFSRRRRSPSSPSFDADGKRFRKSAEKRDNKIGLTELFGGDSASSNGSSSLPPEQLDTAIAYKVRTIVTTLLMSVTQKRAEAICRKVVAAEKNAVRKNSKSGAADNRRPLRGGNDDRGHRSRDEYVENERRSTRNAGRNSIEQIHRQKSTTSSTASVQPPQSDLVKNMLGVYGGDDDDDTDSDNNGTGAADNNNVCVKSSSNRRDDSPPPTTKTTTSRWDSKSKVKILFGREDDAEQQMKQRNEADKTRRYADNGDVDAEKRDGFKAVGLKSKEYRRSTRHSRSNTAEFDDNENGTKRRRSRTRNDSRRRKSRSRSASSPSPSSSSSSPRHQERRSRAGNRAHRKRQRRRYGEHDDRTDDDDSSSSEREASRRSLSARRTSKEEAYGQLKGKRVSGGKR